MQLPPDLRGRSAFNQTQAARAAGVSRTAIGKAIERGRIAVSDSGLIPLEALQAWVLGRRAYRGKPAREVAASPQPAEVAVHELPGEVLAWSEAAVGGAQDVAVLLIRMGLLRERIAQLVDVWVAKQRNEAISCLGDEYDLPPGYRAWGDHPLFACSWLDGTDWAELVAEAADLGPAAA